MAYLELADLRSCLADLGQATPFPALGTSAPATPPPVSSTGQTEAQDLLTALASLKATSAQAQQDTAALAPVIQQKLANLASLQQKLASLRSTTGLGDGSQQFFQGQLQKIDADVRSGRWTDMIVELVRVTPGATASGVQAPQDWFSDPVFSYLTNYLGQQYSPSDPQLLNIAQTAMNALAVNAPLAWDGVTPPTVPPLPAPGAQDNVALLASAKQAAFDPAAYAANNQGFAAYVASRQPQGGGVLKTALKIAALPTQALNQIPGYTKLSANLNKYVPGWQIALNLLIPGGSLLGLASSVLGSAANFPLIGNALTTAGGLISSGYSAASSLPVGGQAIQTVTYLEDKLPFSVSSVAASYLQANGGVSDKLLAAGLESVSEFAFAAEVCAMVLSLGAAAPATVAASAGLNAATISADAALAGAISSATASFKGAIVSAQSGNPYNIAIAATQAAAALVGLGGVVAAASGAAAIVLDCIKYGLQAAQAGITVAKTYVMAQKIKAAADAVKKQAVAEASAIDAQTQLIENQIAQIQAEEAQIQAERAQVAAAARRVPVITPIAQSLGISENAVIYGGLAAALIVIGIVIVMSDDDD